MALGVSEAVQLDMNEEMAAKYIAEQDLDGPVEAEVTRCHSGADSERLQMHMGCGCNFASCSKAGQIYSDDNITLCK